MKLHTINQKLSESNMKDVNLFPLTMKPAEFCYKYDGGNPIKQGYWEQGFSKEEATRLANEYQAQIKPRHSER